MFRSSKISLTTTAAAGIAAVFAVEKPAITHAFTASLPHTTTARSNNNVAALTMVPLSNEEIFARAQQKKKEQEAAAEPPPMLFDEDMLADMQAALLLMEDRVKGGPSSLSPLQVDQLDAQLNKILVEMKQNEHLKPAKPTTAVAPPATAAANPPPVQPQPQQQPPTSINAGPQVIDMDTPSDEGAEYNGRGGRGHPADTVNTYIIPGMDEMSPEEYQKALQQSVIDRQKRRVESGVTGNRSSWNYLNALSGEKGVLKKDDGGDADAKDGDDKKKFTPF